MEFSELVKIRQSDRKYSDKPVEKEKIQECIETARLSPSAHNSQPWKFVIIDDFNLKEQIAGCAASMGMNSFAYQAPVMIAVVLEKMNLATTMGSVIKDKEFSLMDIGIAVGQFCLQAADIGLGTCIIGWFDEKNVKKLLHVDRNKRIPLLISLGYSNSPTRNKVRKPIGEMSSWNRY
ncbi:MAG: nitroreductase family protein [Bacteroidota bacterium]